MLFLAAPFIPLDVAYSQTPFVCSDTATPAVVRSEGLTETVGDMVLVCSGGTPGSTVKQNLTVFLNVNVTNKLVGTTTDVVLTVDTGAGPTPANVSGQLSGPNAVAFNGLSFTVPPSGKVSLQISNLRADANQLGATAPQVITASLAFSGNNPTVNNAQFTVGIPETGLLTGSTSGQVSCYGSPLPSSINLGNLFATGTRFASTRVSEGFASAFQVKDPLSDTGTRIMVRYSGFPASAQLFVPDFVAGSSAIQPTAGGDLGLAASGGQYAPSASGSLLLVRVTGADENGAGGTLAFPAPLSATSFNSASAVTLTNGAGNAVYEVVDANPSVRESAQFPTFLGLASFGDGAAAVANMQVSFAPISTVNVAAAGPIPRFADVTPPSDCSADGDCNAAYFPHLEVDSPPLNVTATEGAFLQTKYVRVHNNGGDVLNWTATITYQSGAGWLTADPPSGADNATIRVDMHPDKVPPGTYQATLTVDAGPLAGSASIPVTFTVTPSQGPAAAAISAIVNAATFQSGALAPGSLATFTGSNFAGSTVTVTFDGVPAKLLYAGSTQINLQVPVELAGKTSTQAVVTVDGQSSAPVSVSLALVAPGIFNPGVLNQDNTLNGVAKPAAGGTVIQIFATGLASPGSGAITARIAGRTITNPAYGGPAPGIPGLQQVNLRIPSDLPPGTTQVEVCALGADPNQPVCSLPAAVMLK